MSDKLTIIIYYAPDQRTILFSAVLRYLSGVVRRPSVAVTPGEERDDSVDLHRGQPGVIYAYRLDFNGDVTHLLDVRDPTPMRLEAGQSCRLPFGPELFQLDWSVPPSTIYLVFLAERDRELEELYQRVPQAPGAIRESYRHRLIGRIARQSAGRIEVPLTEGHSTTRKEVSRDESR